MKQFLEVTNTITKQKIYRDSTEFLSSRKQKKKKKQYEDRTFEIIVAEEWKEKYNEKM